MSKEDSLIKTIGYISFGMLIYVGIFLLKAFALVLLYNWIISPSFAIKEITFVFACGFGIFLEFLGGNMSILSIIIDGDPETIMHRMGRFLFKLTVIFMVILAIRTFVTFPS